MKKIIHEITHFLRICPTCHGRGLIEIGKGDTKECPACKGKGLI